MITKKFRILSLDSGGLYGLFSALLLKELIKQDASFLCKGEVDLFAGTGSGAITALILTKYDQPREGIEEVIQLWKDERLYWNFNPLSFLGLSSWYDAQTLRWVLQEHFGNLKLRDLKHRLLITAFNWAGNAYQPPEKRSWRPKFYYNFPESEPDLNTLVTDLAIRAFSTSFFFSIVDGQQSGTWYAPNPALCGIAKAVHFLRTAPPHYQEFISCIREQEQEKNSLQPLSSKALLRYLSVLSVGFGNKVPYLPVDSENWGYNQWMIGMPNVHLGQWLQPLRYIFFQGPEELTKYQANSLLNFTEKEKNVSNKGFYRLDTDTFKTSVGTDMELLRNNFFYHKWLLHHIENSIHNASTRKALDEARNWLTDNGWLIPEQWECSY